MSNMQPVMHPIYDGDWRLIGRDDELNRRIWQKFDKVEQKFVYRVDYPVDDILAQNREAANSASSDWKGEMHRVASVPVGLMYSEKTGLNDAFKQQDRKYLAKWLNDSDNRGWRTKGGKL